MVWTKKFSLSLKVASFLRWDHGKGTSLRVACTLLLRLQLECWGQCWAPHYRQDCDTLGTVQGRPERWLKDWSVLGGEAERAVTVQPREEKAQGTDPCVQTPDGRSKEEAARLLPVVPSDRTTGSGQKWEYRKLHAQHPSLHWVLITHITPLEILHLHPTSRACSSAWGWSGCGHCWSSLTSHPDWPHWGPQDRDGRGGRTLHCTPRPSFLKLLPDQSSSF